MEITSGNSFLILQSIKAVEKLSTTKTIYTQSQFVDFDSLLTKFYVLAF